MLLTGIGRHADGLQILQLDTAKTARGRTASAGRRGFSPCFLWHGNRIAQAEALCITSPNVDFAK